MILNFVVSTKTRMSCLKIDPISRTIERVEISTELQESFISSEGQPLEYGTVVAYKSKEQSSDEIWFYKDEGIKGICYLTGCKVQVGNRDPTIKSCPVIAEKRVKFKKIPKVYVDVVKLLEQKATERQVSLDESFYFIDHKNRLSELASNFQENELNDILEEVFEFIDVNVNLTPDKVFDLLDTMK